MEHSLTTKLIDDQKRKIKLLQEALEYYANRESGYGIWEFTIWADRETGEDIWSCRQVKPWKVAEDALKESRRRK